MKRNYAVLVTLAALVLGACGGTAENTGTTAPAGTTTAEATTTTRAFTRRVGDDG